jgi:phi13 family phage major tail protein
MPENKVSFGLTNVHYATVTYTGDTPAYGTPTRIPGGVELTLDPKGETTDFYADNILYYSATANQGYEGALTIAEIPDSFKVEVLNEAIDDISKVITENSNAKPATIALMFEFDGDINATRHVLYHCTVARPPLGSTTKTEATEPNTKELSLVAAPRPSDGIVKRSTTPDTPALTYDAWFTAVHDV